MKAPRVPVRFSVHGWEESINECKGGKSRQTYRLPWRGQVLDDPVFGGRILADVVYP